MLFAIHAYETTYGGSHGVEDFSVIECQNVIEAAEIAVELARDVVHSYDNCEVALYKKVASILGVEMGELEEQLMNYEEINDFEDACEEAEREMICYDLYELDENCGATLEYLNSLGFDEIIEKFSKICEN